MNHSLTTEQTLACADNADAVLIRRTQQQATDQYPRLAALSFTLHPSGVSPLDATQLMRFHVNVDRRMGEFSKRRSEAGKPSQPTVLRWLWEEQATPACRMLMLFSLAVCYHPWHDASPGEGIEAISISLTES